MNKTSHNVKILEMDLIEKELRKNKDKYKYEQGKRENIYEYESLDTGLNNQQLVDEKEGLWDKVSKYLSILLLAVICVAVASWLALKMRGNFYSLTSIKTSDVSTPHINMNKILPQMTFYLITERER